MIRSNKAQNSFLLLVKNQDLNRRVSKRKYDNHCTGKKYPMKYQEKTDYKPDIQILNSLFIAERYHVLNCCIIAYAQTMYCRQSFDNVINVKGHAYGRDFGQILFSASIIYNALGMYFY